MKPETSEQERRPQPPRAEASFPKRYFTGPELSSAPVSVGYKRRWGHAGAEDLTRFAGRKPLEHSNWKFVQNSPPRAPRNNHRGTCGYQAAPEKLASVSPLEGIRKRGPKGPKPSCEPKTGPQKNGQHFPLSRRKTSPRRIPRQGKPSRRGEGGKRLYASNGGGTSLHQKDANCRLIHGPQPRGITRQWGPAC